jgi:hypothetical protein
MIVLLAAFIVFFCLALGSIAFLACVLIPPTRKYALSTALWFAVWGPCCVLFLILAIVGLVAGGIALRATQMHWEDAPKLISAIGWGSVVVFVIVTCIIASVAGWLHQALIHRFTFMLFRLYAALVTAGIGCVIGMLLVILSMVWGTFPLIVWVTGLSVPILMGALSTTAYKHSSALRGNAPTRFTWISSEEFAGTADSQD